MAGGGVEHGGHNAPLADKTWTLPRGWRCGFGAGGGGCERDRHRQLIQAIVR